MVIFVHAFILFSLGFLLINFFYVDKLQACGLSEELMSVIIIAYSVVQMVSETVLDRIKHIHYRALMLWSAVLSGMIMMVFAWSRTTVVVIGIMVILPLFLSIPAYILDGMENAYIDRCGQADQRATVLSVANMVGNLIEIVFLFASACIVNIGIAACFMGVGMLLITLGTAVYQKGADM